MGTPFNKEVAIGAVAPDGTFFVDERRTQMLEIQQPYIEREAALQVEEIKRRIKKYKGSEELPHIKERTVILVDDGIATGYTILAAIKSIRKQGAEKLVLAVPVAPEDTLEVLGELVDEIICLLIPKNFRAVGLYYEDFDQVTDDEVQTIIKELSSPPLS